MRNTRVNHIDRQANGRQRGAALLPYVSVLAMLAVIAVGAIGASGKGVRQVFSRIAGSISESARPLESAAPLDKPMPTAAHALASKTFVFSPHTDAVQLINPERGFFQYVAFDALQSFGSLKSISDAGTRLVYCGISLKEFTNQPLNADMLKRIDSALTQVEAAGLKLILRFNYGNDDWVADASLNQALAHIEQLKPVLQKHASIILVEEMGFIGKWGEGNDSPLSAPASKRAIANKLISAAGGLFPIYFRRPSDVQSWFGSSYASQHIGLFNDCYLCNDTDGGSYPLGLNDPLRSYAKRFGINRGMLGETGHPMGGTPRFSCAQSLKESREYGVIALNNGWYTGFIDSIQPCWKEFSEQMGAVYRLDRLTFDTAIKSNATARLTLTVRNIGMGPALTARSAQIVFKTANGVITAPVQMTGNRLDRIAPGSSAALRLTFQVPQLAAGTYQVGLRFPDAAPALAARSIYAVRPANADKPSAGQYWDAANAIFWIGSNTVTR